MRLLLLAAVLGLPLAAQVKLRHSPDRISVEIDGKPFTEFFISSGQTKPYLHPLRAASGRPVTRYFPMELVDGERRDHPHQRGLWFTHGDVNGLDFWTSEPGRSNPKQGRIVLRKVNDLQDGKKSGWLEATFEWQGPDGAALLTEARRMTFTAEGSLRIIDVDVTLGALAKAVFGDTKEGAFGIRVAPWLEEDDGQAPKSPQRTGRITNSAGGKGEKECWGKRAEWVDYSGEIEGERLGITVFDHPSNLRHPTYWHARGYGLVSCNPFGARDFENDKSKDGSFTLEAGQRQRFRYRVIIHPGDAQAAGIAALWEKYRKTK